MIYVLLDPHKWQVYGKQVEIHLDLKVKEIGFIKINESQIKLLGIKCLVISIFYEYVKLNEKHCKNIIFIFFVYQFVL